MKLSLPQLGITIVLVSLTFFFAALLLAFGLRVQTEAIWQRFQIPSLLWLGTAILILSSIALEAARYALRRALLVVYRGRVRITFALGILFLGMQCVSAADLIRQGVAVASNPRGSAFYIFMGIHGVHLLAGVFWLSWLWKSSDLLFRGGEQAIRGHRRHLDAATLFWHFMGILWIVMFWFLRQWAIES
ncbi:MAG: cytochrome c oxidase subunit 3 [Bryobacteraceae bacterium]|nr:cytochrome c oxidase subunit 3 [Bryobacteraceae bacterium]